MIFVTLSLGSISKKRQLLLAMVVACVLSGCQTDPPQDTAPAEAVGHMSDVLPDSQQNAHFGSKAETPSDQEKEKVLDLASKMSGKKFSAEERNIISRMLGLNEGDLIKGLGVFAVLSGGRYPSKLDAKTTIKETDRLGQNTRMSRDETKEKAQDIFFAAAYYEKLMREKKDVAYCGDKVTFEDSGKVLMRWRISDAWHRVVFGNLTRKTVTAQELAELEILNSQ
ncbi:MAG: hypothetical protein ACYTEQ_08095 [Planctomycetota bacterium]|jgi:hypothetical protein